MTETTRFDIYGLIHKALRAVMGETLTAAGRMDALDDADTAAALAQVRTLLAMCRSHLEHENDVVHPALEARRPGSSAHAARDHVQHLDAIAMLEVQARRVETAQGAARMVAAGELYRVLALFVAENFEHMHVEETKNNPALWAAYSDAELIEIHEALIASIPTAEMNEVLRIMVPNVTPFERAVMLGEMQSKAPAAVFSGVLELVRPALSARDWDKLMFALAPLPIAA